MSQRNKRHLARLRRPRQEAPGLFKKACSQFPSGIISAFVIALLFYPFAHLRAAEVPTLTPAYKHVLTLVASSDLNELKYLAFPIIQPLSTTEILVGYKRGDSHALGKEATFELLHLNPVTERTGSERITLRHPNVIFQDGEFVRFGNGDIACYIDVQAGQVEGKKQIVARMGLQEFRSRDGGKTFHDAGKLGVIDGVEYGYVFEAITEGNTTWMLAMTFANLPGGKAIGASNPAAGSVDVLRTDDHGKTWRMVRNLTAEFGNLKINESSFARDGDGFIVSTRGYTSQHWLQVTDDDFKMKRQLDITGKYPFIESYVGRPRVFTRDGQWYLLGRNFMGGTGSPASSKAAVLGPMKLSLFRFDPATLEISKHVVLDNATNESVSDGYYAVPYWQERQGKTFLNVVTYKRIGNRNPDIIRLEYLWDEVK